MPNTRKLLSITDLKKYLPVAKSSLFQKESLYVRANEEITLDIYEGETVGIVGESGCGKSTLGRVLLQLYEQTAGSAMYYGRTLSEVAPYYIEHTLKNASKYLTKYKNAQALADKLTAECDALGDSATFYKLQEKNLAVANARSALMNIVKIMGGFIVTDELEQSAKVLLKEHHINVAIAKYNHKIADLAAEIELLHTQKDDLAEEGKDTASIEKKITAFQAKIERIADSIEALEAKKPAIKEELNALKAKHADNAEFAKYEEMLDDGVDLARLKYSEMRHLRKDLQIIFQDPYSSLDPRMTIGQIIEEGLVTHNFFKHGSSKMQEYILQTMRDCGLQDYMLHRYPHQFSGGQRQRICIARALAVKPKFVVCDECVSALDVSIQSQIINLLQELQQKEKFTYMFISHDLSVVRYISDRIAVMYLGNIVELAPSEEIFKDPRHPYTVALLSSIPTTDPDDLNKERIILEGNIPSPIRPPDGCKFHTRCFMACEKCKCVQPPLVEVEPGHFVACHFAEKKLDEKGEYLFELPKMEKKSSRLEQLEVMK
ncbi:MAG: ATP-binding cassette domain-containing protein [Clostridia bacterium]|nr:ATP-binding cassette domain-containing protein [Clostridia bacterium]